MTDSELTDAAFALKDQGGNAPLEDYFETLCELADQPASVLFPRLVALRLAHSSDAELLDLTFGE